MPGCGWHHGFEGISGLLAGEGSGGEGLGNMGLLAFRPDVVGGGRGLMGREDGAF